MYDDKKIHISNDELPTNFSLDDILAEYKAAVPDTPEEPESLTQRSKRIVMEALDQTVNEGKDPERQISEMSFSSIDDIIGEAVSEQEYPVASAPRDDREKKPAFTREQEKTRESAQKQGEQSASEEEAHAQPGLTEREREIISQIEREHAAKAARGSAAEEKKSPEQTDAIASETVNTDDREEYASHDFPESDLSDEEAPTEKKKPARDRFMSPLVAILALLAIRRQQRQKAEEQTPIEDEDTQDDDVPEMDAEKASRLYASQMHSLKLRGKIATVMSLVMIYLTFAFYSSLPLAGALNGSVKAVSIVMMIFELTVMVTGLDVFTAGLMSLSRNKPGPESLAAVSCILTLLDAAVLSAMGTGEMGLPFCAVSAVSMTFAIWGSYYTCKGYRTSFKLLAMSKKLYCVTGENGITGTGVALMKSERGTKGFIRRSEEADLPEYAYSVLTPMLLALSLVLGLLASVAHGQPKAVMHCIAVIAAVSSSFSSALCFALPFSITAKRLFQSGAAIAGWAGTRDIGKSRHIVITDREIFPQGTIELGGIRILEGAFTDKVISYTGSVVAASGSGLAAPFAELIKRNGYSISRVENFAPHDGGGMTAMVNGENVYVGNAGFMNLMGIRVPQKLSTKSSLFTAINGGLVGIFTVNYKPVASVQEALAILLRSNREPVFAIRDFNITPMLIKQKFRLPTDVFKFPSYSERFRISGTEPDANSKIAAVISREGMGPLVDAADRGRRLFSAVRMGTAISAAGSVLGAIIMFFLCWAGAFDSATASNALIFMLLWLIPSIVVSWGLQR